MSKSTKNSAHIRLSDNQLVALSSATQREDGVISISDRLKGAAAQKFVATLIEKGLAREVRAKPGMPVARRDEDGRAYALVVTKLGRTTGSGRSPENGRSVERDPVQDDAELIQSLVERATIESRGIEIAFSPGGGAQAGTARTYVGWWGR